MRIIVLGAGPAGLYCAYLLGRRLPGARVELFEQNPPDATFGFGVVFSDRALEFLATDDAETHAAIAPHLETWRDITLVHDGRQIRIDGIGFAAIGRLELLQILQERLRTVGIAPVWRHRVSNLAELPQADLVIGADGVNSLVRRTFADAFGTSVEDLTNRFIWFGTTARFPTLTQTFRLVEGNAFNAHHYRYKPAMSTFIVEVDAASFERLGLREMPPDAARRLCERVFADQLDDRALVSNNSTWRCFPRVRNERWSHGRYVLIGDALRTAHFSIGSGTRLAMEDAIALVEALRAHPRDVPEALAAYETARRPVVEKLLAAADASAAWYEQFREHMRLAPADFAMSYITRSGRIDPDRLRQTSPAFAGRWLADVPATPGGRRC